MAVIDIFAPQVSVVAEGMEGKTILVYGNNGLGKTKQLTRLPKPFYFAFERGINAISGVPFLPMNSWSDFIKVVKQLSKNSEKALESYQTLIVDTVEVSYKKCEEYVCEQYDAVRIKDGNSGYGLWREVEDEYWKWINTLTNLGFTVAFIAHETEQDETDPDTGEEYTKKYPKGDKRAIKPICDLVDFICYVESNGVDEKGSDIMSSAYFKDCKHHKARSRFIHMVSKLQEFTAENLQKAIKDAIAKESEDGGTVVSYQQQQETYSTDTKSFEDLQNAIKDIALKLHKKDKADETNHMQKYSDIVESYLGTGKTVKDSTEKQVQQLDLILIDLQEYIKTI